MNRGGSVQTPSLASLLESHTTECTKDQVKLGFMKRNAISTIFLLPLCLCNSWAVDAADTAAEGSITHGSIQFSRDVLPILSDRCFHCHGPDAEHREAGLRLDQRESAVDEMDAVVPGDPDESELINRIVSDDPDVQMPPPESHRKPVTTAEIEVLRQWIAEGAKWGKHWAFERPVKTEIDDSRSNPIDVFVHRRLKEEGLEPSPDADRRTLIRRLTLDLIGLPPSTDEVNAFLAEDSPGAYINLVDRLLASKHYGERMAWPWLDAARYADTSGFQGDPERSMWPWRDWVIDALNNNMPFDQFTIEQLAGDLLENPTPEQQLATGFNRNHMHNGEGGRIAEETRIENVFDRTETTGTVWLGLTLQCARCHDHKFDPTSNRDYFAFFDFFNQTSESGGGNRSLAIPPSMEYLDQDRLDLVEKARQKVATLKSKWTAPSKAADAAQAAWMAEFQAQPSTAWHEIDVTSAESTGGATITIADDSILHVTGKRPEQDVYEIKASSRLGRITAVRLEALVDPESPAKSTGRDENGNFVLSEFEFFSRSIESENSKNEQVKFAAASASREQGGLIADLAIDGNSGETGWAPGAHTHKEPSHATFSTLRPVEIDAATELTFRLHFESKHTHHTLAKFRLLVTDAQQFDSVDVAVKEFLEKPADKRTEDDRAKLREHFLLHHWTENAGLVKQWKAAQTELKKLEKENQPTPVMVMDMLGKPRETLVLVKGIYNDATDQSVTANVPSMLPPLLPKESNERYTRLDLARWIMSPKNPLTARVTVNRYWQTFFGRGIVLTPSDFGLQGAQPTHPALLDWLAVEFVESGWDVKYMHRLIVTSQTYRQSARVTPELIERDPRNELLARASRYRMPSWMIRDASLAASGLLNRELGGPPVKSYQPDGIWAEATFGKIKYKMDSGDDLYRRSLYSFWRRIVGPTVFFDSSKRQTCEVQPNLTNTPLHALTTLNDATYVEAARVMAERMIRTHDSGHDQIVETFVTLTSRQPEPNELQLLEKRLASTRAQFKAAPDDAKALLAVGEAPRDQSIEISQHAALTTLINTMMNLDEFLVKP